MRQMLRQIFIPLGLIASSLSLVGCANLDQKNDAYHYPSAISYVWDDGRITFMVPQRGIAFNRTVFTPTSEVSLDEQGSYFTINGIYPKFTLSDQIGNPLQVIKN